MDRVRYLHGLAEYLGLPADRAVAGAIVVPVESRRGERLVSHYHVGEASVIMTDPDLAPALARWHGRSTAVPFEEFAAWAVGHGAVLLGRGVEHLLPDGDVPPSWRPELTVLDGSSPTVIELVGVFLDACSPEDRDDAEFDLDALDPFLVGWVEHGRLLALAGGRPEPMRPGCHDIGVLTHPEGRLAGRGRAVVAAVVDLLVAAGEEPLYRCSDGNVGSKRLCDSLGFEVVAELEAYRWPDVPAESPTA